MLLVRKDFASKGGRRVKFSILTSLNLSVMTFPWLHDEIIGVFIALVLLQIVMTFAVADLRSSKWCFRMYRLIGSTRYHCAAVCDSDLFVVFGDDELGLRVIGSIVFGCVGIVLD
jgi:hypothetical protein